MHLKCEKREKKTFRNNFKIKIIGSYKVTEICFELKRLLSYIHYAPKNHDSEFEILHSAKKGEKRKL